MPQAYSIYTTFVFNILQNFGYSIYKDMLQSLVNLIKIVYKYLT